MNLFGIVTGKCPSAVTSATISRSSIRTDVDILRCVFMAMWAVCLLLPERFATPNIFCKSDQFHVIWIHAASNAARVVHGQSIRDSSNQAFIRDAVGGSLVDDSTFTAYKYLSVTGRICAAEPKPASTVRLGTHHLEKSFQYRNTIAWAHTSSIAQLRNGGALSTNC